MWYSVEFVYIYILEYKSHCQPWCSAGKGFRFQGCPFTGIQAGSHFSESVAAIDNEAKEVYFLRSNFRLKIDLEIIFICASVVPPPI